MSTFGTHNARELEIHFGAMAPPLSEQFKAQGLKLLVPDSLEHHQRDADAITRLAIREILPRSEVARARKRLMRKLTATQVYDEH